MIIIRDDVPDSDYVVDEADYPAVVTLFQPDDCAATLFHESGLVTVAHCGVDLGPGDALQVGGRPSTVAEVTLHPMWTDGDNGRGSPPELYRRELEGGCWRGLWCKTEDSRARGLTALALGVEDDDTGTEDEHVEKEVEAEQRARRERLKDPRMKEVGVLVGELLDEECGPSADSATRSRAARKVFELLAAESVDPPRDGEERENPED